MNIAQQMAIWGTQSKVHKCIVCLSGWLPACLPGVILLSWWLRNLQDSVCPSCLSGCYTRCICGTLLHAMVVRKNVCTGDSHASSKKNVLKGRSQEHMLQACLTHVTEACTL